MLYVRFCCSIGKPMGPPLRRSLGTAAKMVGGATGSKLDHLISKIGSHKPPELQKDEFEAYRNQMSYVAKKSGQMRKLSKNETLSKLESLLETGKSITEVDLGKEVNRAKTSRALLGIYGKSKFYLSEELTVNLFERFATLLATEAREARDASGDGRPEQTFLKDPRFRDLLTHVDTNFAKYAPQEQLGVLLAINKIEGRQFKDIIQKKIECLYSPKSLESLNSNELAFFLKLVASFYGSQNFICKMVNDALMARFMELYEEGSQTVVMTEDADAPRFQDPRQISGDCLCQLVGSFGKLNYRGTLGPLLATEIVKHDLLQKIRLTSLCYCLSGIHAIRNDLREAVVDKANQWIRALPFERLEQEREDTLRNILISLQKERGCVDSVEVICKSILFRKARLESKSFVFVLDAWVATRFRLFEMEKKKLVFLYDKILNRASVRDCLQIAAVLMRLGESGAGEPHLSLDTNEFFRKLVNRLLLLQKSFTKGELQRLKTILNKGDPRLKALEKLV